LALGGTEVEGRGCIRTVMGRQFDVISLMMLPFTKQLTVFFPENQWNDFADLLKKARVDEERHYRLQQIIKEHSLEKALEDIIKFGKDEEEINGAQEATRILWKIVQLDFPDYKKLVDEISHSLEDRLKKKATSTSDLNEKKQLLRMATTASTIRGHSKDERGGIETEDDWNKINRELRKELRRKVMPNCLLGMFCCK
ncbi:hypothetical protein PMAYCL1PPCAC_04797, partial [Pristionchus mayeri]